MNISQANKKTTPKIRILFLGETYRADAQTWIKGIEKASGLRIDTAEIKTIQFRPIRVLQSVSFIIRLLFNRYFGPQYDLVLAERSTSYGFFSLFTNAKIKVVAQQGISDIFPLSNWSIFIKSTLQRIVYTKVDIIHAWGEAMVPAMLKSGAQPKKIMVLAKGIDLDKFKYKEKLTQKPFELKAIVTRSLEKDYQHWNILKVVALLKKNNIFLKVIIVGGGSLLEPMKTLAQDLDIQELIQFTGRIPNDELPKLMYDCLIYISVPTTEGVSSSLFEAMASGCFPIVTNLPGTRPFINSGKNGYLVNVDDPQDLCDHITEFIKNPSMFQQAIESNRKWIEINCNVELNMNKFWNRYTQELEIKQ